MQALARACVPDARCAIPTETEAVVERLIRHLAPLLDTTNEMDELDPLGPADSALVRLTSSEALLRLARVHDARIHPEVYLALALTMQVCTAPHIRNGLLCVCLSQICPKYPCLYVSVSPTGPCHASGRLHLHPYA